MQYIHIGTTALVIQPISSDDAKIQYGHGPNSINSHSSLVSKFLVLLDVSINGIFFLLRRAGKDGCENRLSTLSCLSVRLSCCPHPPARLLLEGFS